MFKDELGLKEQAWAGILRSEFLRGRNMHRGLYEQYDLGIAKVVMALLKLCKYPSTVSFLSREVWLCF